MDRDGHTYITRDQEGRNVYLVNAQQMRDMDRFAMEEIGIPGIVLMEAAGQAVVREVEERYAGFKIVVVAGHGNNGGDAFVVSRHLSNKGYQVTTWFTGSEERMSHDCSLAYQALTKSRYTVKKLDDSSWESFSHDLGQAQLIIDGLLGTGFQGKPREPMAKVINQINEQLKAYIIAIDIPSGVNADTGLVIDSAIQADMTITFAYPKWGQLLFPGASYCGELLIRDITIPSWVGKELKLTSYLLQEEQVSQYIPLRKRHSHKGSYGHVLIIAGSEPYIGAPGLAALGAIRSGSGMVTLAIPQSIQPLVAGSVPEAVYWLWPEKGGSLSPDSWKVLAERVGAYDCTVVGPGIGQAAGVSWLKEVIQNTSGPLLLDADALNLLAKDLSMIKGRQDVILTPHPGEMARLLGVSVKDVEQNRPQMALQFAQKHQVYLILKGTYPIIATPQGECYVSPRGSSSLAKGGSGDVLSGMIGSFINQTGSILSGIILAVYVHGMAGEFMDEYSGAASDLGLWIGKAVHHLKTLQKP